MAPGPGTPDAAERVGTTVENSRPIRVAALVGVTAALAAAALARAWGAAPRPATLAWLAVCLAGERLWLRLPAGKATLSMATPFVYAAALVLPAHEAMLAAGVATLAAELAFMRKPLERALFNACHTVLATGATAWAFAAAGGETSGLGEALLKVRVTPFAAAAAAFYAVNRGAVTLAVALAESRTPAAVWRWNFAGPQDALLLGASLALGAVLVVLHGFVGLGGVLLLALPLVALFEGHRAHLARAAGGGTTARERRAA